VTEVVTSIEAMVTAQWTAASGSKPRCEPELAMMIDWAACTALRSGLIYILVLSILEH